MSRHERFTPSGFTKFVIRRTMPLAIVALCLGFAAGCGLPRANGSRGVAFGTALGAEASGQPFTVLRFTPSGPNALVTGSALARHPSGDVVVAGYFVDTANVGLGPASLGTAAFVGRYTPSGTPRWVRWVRASNNSAPQIAVDAKGDVYLVGETQYAPRPFGEPDPASCTDRPTCKSGHAIHALSADGDVRWSRVLPSADSRERMTPALVAAVDGVTIAGRFGAGEDTFVARYERDTGERRWFTRLRGPSITSLAVAADGTTFVGGMTLRDLHVDDAHVHARGMEAGYVARLSAKDGVAQWGTRLGGDQVASRVFAIAPDPRGDLVVVSRRGVGTETVVVEVLAARDGATRTTRRFPARSSTVTTAAIDMAPDGSPLVALTRAVHPKDHEHRGDDQDGVPITTVMGFTPKLEPTWQRDLRAAAGARPAWRVDTASLVALSATEAIVTGSFVGRVELGGALAEAPWAHEKRRCPTFEDEDDDCTHDWAARAMFVARIKR